MPKQFLAPKNHQGGASSGITQAVRAGNLILVGGQMSLDEQGRVVGNDIATQARNAFEALKRVLAEATSKDIVTFMSVAGLPARAVRTPWLSNYLKHEKGLQSNAKADARRCVPGLNCLTVCGLRDGIGSIGQFCIDTRLAYALKGDVKKGLFFRGSEPLPFGSEIRPVAELIGYLMTGAMPGPLHHKT